MTEPPVGRFPRPVDTAPLDRASANALFTAIETCLERGWRAVTNGIEAVTGLSPTEVVAVEFCSLAVVFFVVSSMSRTSRIRALRRDVDLRIKAAKVGVSDAARRLGAESFDIRYLYAVPQVRVVMSFGTFDVSGEARDATHSSAVDVALATVVRLATEALAASPRAKRFASGPAPAASRASSRRPDAKPRDRFAEDSPWWVVLGLGPDATRAEAKAAYRSLAKIHHPDAGGSSTLMARLADARDDAIGRGKVGKARPD